MPEEPAKKEKRLARNRTRAQLIDRLRSEDAEDLAEPLEKCGTPVPLTCVCCGSRKCAETHCMARYCPSCQPIITAERWHRWNAALAGIQWPLFVTLTLPNSEDPESLRFLRKKWGQFRRRKIIADQVKGGMITFEVTNKGNGWHPHLHAFLDCEWLSLHVPPPRIQETKAVIKQKCHHAQAELSAAWADMIGEEKAIVWIQRVYGDGAIKEVLKYAVKGSDLLAAAEPIAPMLRVLKKTRTLSGFGTLHPLPKPNLADGPAILCEDCGAAKSFMPDEILEFLGRTTTSAGKGRSVSPTKQRTQ